ncbi:hypothetical protein D3C71_1751680 [compost metagenome]
MTDSVDAAKTAEIRSDDNQCIEGDQPQRGPNLLLEADSVGRHLIFEQDIDHKHQDLQAEQPGDGIPTGPVDDQR